MITTPRTLTPKRQRFADAYVTNGGNGAQAYRDAGYQVASLTVATTESHKLLTNPDVCTAITRKQARLQAVSDVTRQDVIAGLMDIAVNGKRESVQLGAWSKLADILGLVVRKVDIRDDRNPLREAYEAMTFEALLEHIETLKALPAGPVIDGEVVEGEVRDPA